MGFSSGQSIQFENPGNGKELLENLKMGGVELDESVLMEINSIRELVTAIRSLKAERKQANNKEVVFSYVAEDDKAILLQRHEASILASAGASEFKRVDSPPSGAPGVVTSFGFDFPRPQVRYRRRGRKTTPAQGSGESPKDHPFHRGKTRKFVLHLQGSTRGGRRSPSSTCGKPNQAG